MFDVVQGDPMSIFLIVVGFIIARFGAGLFVVGEAKGGQDAGSGLLTLVVQLVGWGMVIWGIFRMFT